MRGCPKTMAVSAAIPLRLLAASLKKLRVQYAIRNERYRYIANIPYDMETYKPESWTKPLSQQLYVRPTNASPQATPSTCTGWC